MSILIRVYEFPVKWKRTLEPKYLLFILVLLPLIRIFMLFPIFSPHTSHVFHSIFYLPFCLHLSFKYLIKWFLCQIKRCTGHIFLHKKRRDNNILVKELHFGRSNKYEHSRFTGSILRCTQHSEHVFGFLEIWVVDTRGRDDSEKSGFRMKLK